MITAVIPTLNAERGLAATLSALVPATVDGLVRQVVVADGGSQDRTLEIADAAGAEIVKCRRGRGRQLAAGAERARFDWLLFLHAGTVLTDGWDRETAGFIGRVESGGRSPAGAAFRFALDDPGLRARVIETGVACRCKLFGLPCGDQGLLIPRSLYRELGGYRPLPHMEDIDLVRRLGRQRLAILRAAAVTSANRYREDGYVRPMLRNLRCLALLYLRVPADRIARLYEK
jgi:rSAM/selenodomain-associated transferase 2